MSFFAFCLVAACGLSANPGAEPVSVDRLATLPPCISQPAKSESPPELRGETAQTIGWLLPSKSRFCIRLAGRRTRDENLELTSLPRLPSALHRRLVAMRPWLLALAMSLAMLMVAPARASDALGPPRGAQGNDQPYDDLPLDDILGSRGSSIALAAGRRPTSSASKENGSGFPRYPFYGMPHVVVIDPADYPRPRSLENNNPNRFWYSMRPNILNIPVEDDWDFYNIINTDRPDFTDAVYSVGKGVTFLENGFTFTKINTFDQHVSTRQLPESLLRHGITDEFELRLKWPGYLMTTVRDPHSGAQLNMFGSEDIDVGFKWEMLQQAGWRPMTTLVAGMTLPTGTPATSAQFVQPHFNLVAGWGLRRWLYVKTQTGCDFVHSTTTQIVTPLAGASNPTFLTVRSPPNSWHESISVLTQWSKRVGAFHEWFMISGTGGGDRSAKHYLDMGLFLYATPNVQFDVRLGRQLSDRVNDFFTGAGFSGRW